MRLPASWFARALVAGVGLSLAAAPEAPAQVPLTMSYQGRLLDVGGAPVADGDYQLTFRIYEVAAGPDASIWSEVQAATPVSSGLFHVLLGAVHPLALAFDRPYWLGVAIGNGAELTPRIALASSPYSLIANSVADGAITGPKIAPGQVVKSLNAMTDDVSLTAGSNIAIVPAGQTLTISATGVGSLGLPFASTTNDAGTLFDVGNSGTGGAGVFRISNAVNANPALLARTSGTGSAFVADGIADVGGSTRSGELRLFRNGVASAMLDALTTANGGRFQLHDEAGNQMLYLAPDANGTGAFLELRRNAANTGLLVDGNSAGTGEPRMDLLGSARTVTFDLSAAADNSVVLPADAIASAETLDEPGLAYRTDGASVIALDGTTQTLLSRSITVPAAGYVLVLGSLVGEAQHVNLTTDAAIFGVSNAAGAFATDRIMALINPSSLPTASYYYPITVQGVFPVAAGASTFYLLADESTGAFRARNTQLTLVYLRTAYGTVDAPLAGGESGPERARDGLSPADVAAEQAEGRAFAAARLEREVAEMRARLDELMRRIETERLSQRAAEDAAAGAPRP